MDEVELVNRNQIGLIHIYSSGMDEVDLVNRNQVLYIYIYSSGMDEVELVNRNQVDLIYIVLVWTKWSWLTGINIYPKIFLYFHFIIFFIFLPISVLT